MFLLQTDASDVGVGTVLSQKFEGEEHPIPYISRKLFLTEKGYSVIEKGALAVRCVMDSLRYHLLGNLLLIMDHALL